MHSKLELNSEVGIGSVFSFSIDVVMEEGEKQLWNQASEIKNVLVCDDNENNRHILANMLQHFQIRHEELENELLVQEKLQHGDFDCLLIDYEMPNKNGVQIIDELYATLPSEVLQKLSVILVHSSANDHVLNDAVRRYDLTQSIVKPITANKLINTLGRMRKRFDLKNDEVKEHQDTVSKQAFKILIVDDNEINLLLAKNVMQLLLPNANIMECLSAEEALEHVVEFQPEFVLMDIQMPGMSGYEATKHIRKLLPDKHIPIVALTAGVSQKDRDRSKEAGLDDFVSKPLRIDDLKDLVKKFLVSGEEFSNITLDSRDAKEESNVLRHVNTAAILASVGNDKAMFTEFISFLKQGSFDALYADAIQVFSTEKLYSETMRTMLHRLIGVAASAKFEILTDRIHAFREAREVKDKNLREFLLPIIDELNYLKEYIQTL